MNHTLLLAQIVSILGGVTGVGGVHDYERYSRSFAEWQILMEDTGIINGWTVSRVGTEVSRETVATVINRHKFKIKGYYKVDDANGSEIVLQELLDTIKTAFNGKKTLNGVALNSDPLTIDSVGIKELAPEYIVHAPEMTLIAEERAWL